MISGVEIGTLGAVHLSMPDRNQLPKMTNWVQKLCVKLGKEEIKITLRKEETCEIEDAQILSDLIRLNPGLFDTRFTSNSRGGSYNYSSLWKCLGQFEFRLLSKLDNELEAYQQLVIDGKESTLLNRKLHSIKKKEEDDSNMGWKTVTLALKPSKKLKNRDQPVEYTYITMQFEMQESVDKKRYIDKCEITSITAPARALCQFEYKRRLTYELY
tara:strand:+ start:218 stop:859 length:642 start_codon:yes stop_codon:yes gene_type:complete